MRVISFSLYGTDPRYLVGAVENARDAKKFYPGWIVHVWHEQSLPTRIEQALTDAGAWRHWGPDSFPNKMFWRFLAHDLPGVERWISRDVDSRFSSREVKAVDEWIESGKQLHVMRDHPLFHLAPIMGGLFGWKKEEEDFRMATLMQPWANKVRYGQDQDFLANSIWPRAKSKLVHDVRRNWPPDGPNFCGEYISASGEPNEDHRKSRLKECQKSSICSATSA